MTENVVTVVVEIPGGSRNKYEMDHDTGLVYLDRMLFTATRYPADYGFIEGTMGEDGDPLDALVFVGEPTFPGCRIVARPIGNFGMRDEKGPGQQDPLCPAPRSAWSYVEELEDLRAHPPQRDRALLALLRSPVRNGNASAPFGRGGHDRLSGQGRADRLDGPGQDSDQRRGRARSPHRARPMTCRSMAKR